MWEASEFFFFFLSVTYSRVFKKKKCSYKLAIVAFFKNVTIGHLYTPGPMAAFLKNVAIGPF